MVEFNNRQRGFFHGTDVPLKLGEHITPASSRGSEDRYGNNAYDTAPKGRKVADWAFASQSENTAWKYAHSAARGALDGINSTFSDQKRGTETGRGRVYKVSPVTEPVRGPEFYDRGHDEHVAKAWKVTGQIDSQPGRQSALPGTNWNQHRTKWAVGDANHPQPLKTETLTHHDELPAMTHPGQLDLFNNRSVKENAGNVSMRERRSPEQKYHFNSFVGKKVSYTTQRQY